MTRHYRPFSKLLLAAACFVGTVQADLIVSAPTVLASPGSSGRFNILLTNTGTPIGVGAFSFDISTVSPGVDFTDASTNTAGAPYIFAGNSFAEINGLPLATTTGEELIASDAANSGGVSLYGTAYSLGEVSYSIAPSATLPVAITFSITGTTLSDPTGFLYPVTTVAGQLTSVVPEPSRLGLFAACLASLVLLISRRGPRSTE